MLNSLSRTSDRRLSFWIALVVLFVVLFVFLPAILFSIYQVVHQGEIRYTEQEVEQASRIIDNELSRLDLILLDWSSWDEMYHFTQTFSPDFIDSHLSDTSISNLGVDIMLIFNEDRQLVYAKYIDRYARVVMPMPFEVGALLGAYPSILVPPNLNASRQGMVTLPNLPMLVSSRAILTTAGMGPAHGILVFIRLLDAREMIELSHLTMSKIDIFSAPGQRILVPTLPAPAVLKDQVYIDQLDSERSAGYHYLVDLNGQPGLVMEVDTPRDLFAQGRTTAVVFSGAVLALGFALFIVALRLTYSLLKTRREGERYLRRFQAVVNQSGEAILLVRGNFQILEANPTARRLLAWEPDPAQPATLKELVAFEPDLDTPLVRDLCLSGRASEHHSTRHDGTAFDLELNASQVSVSGDLDYSIVLRDITERKKAENALRASEERYTLAANGANDGLWDWNLASGEIYYSARWKAMLGYTENEISSSPDEWFSRVHPDDLLRLHTQLSDHLRTRTENFECEYRIQHMDGRYLWMLARGVAVWEATGYALRIAGSQTDIHERKQIEEQFRYDALHDGLTGLGNRTLLIDHLQQINERRKRAPELLYALFFLDFDRFKQVNDSLGHQAGDLLLIEVSQRLEKSLRSKDTIARFSGPETLVRIAGDEFVILVEDFQSVEEIYKVAERVTSLLSTPYTIMDREVNLTASIGLVIPEGVYENVEDVIRDADIAMYRAKQNGGAQVVRFNEEMYQGALLRMQLESDLRQAVERREFVVYYQPIYTLGDGCIAGFEALVRWNHPQKGFLPPSEFIYIADEIGLIIPIGYFVLEEACRSTQSWRNEFPALPNITLNVNFSARQIRSPDLVENVQAILDRTGFDPKNLWLEVTETTLVHNDEVVLTHLNELRRLSIRIEIDDFGTGYSSLSYLQNLPVDGFKIDRSFVKDIQSGGQQIVKTLVDLGHNLGLIEVAEGVETDHQKEYLKSVFCDYAQGYLMSQPVSAEKIEELLKKI